MKTINDNPNKAYTDLAVLSELNKARVEYLFDNDESFHLLSGVEDLIKDYYANGLTFGRR